MIFFFDTDNFFSVLVSVQTIYLFLLFFVTCLICNCKFYSASLKLKMTHFSFLKLWS